MSSLGIDRQGEPPARWKALALLFLILAVSLPRLLALDRFVTTDEVLWLARSANFYNALAHHEYRYTYQREHPGVTVMWAGMLGFLARYPEYKDSGIGQVDHLAFHDYLEKQSWELPLRLLVAGRFFLLIGQIASLSLAFWYAFRLVGLLPALLAFLLIAFDPFFLGLSRLLHLDALLSGLMLLSLLSFLLFLRERNLLNLVVSGVAAGLAVLTKSPGMLLLPVVGILVLKDLGTQRQANRERTWSRAAWNTAWPVAAWIGAAALVMLVFWPALWKDPIQPILNVLRTAETYAEQGHETAVFFNGRIVPSGNLGKSFFYFYPLTFLWRTTPVVLLGLATAAIGIYRRDPPFDRPSVRDTLFGVIVLATVFTLALTLGSKKFDRYLLPVHLCADFVAGLGWAFAVIRLERVNFKGLLRYSPAFFLLLVVGAQMFFSLRTFPYYLSYYNPLMGGSRKAPEVMQIGWGEGLDQAGRYIGMKTKPDELKVASWYPVGPFSYFFPGVYSPIPVGPLRSEKNWSDFLENDYVVLYIHQKQRGLFSKRIEEYLSGREPEYTVWIDGLEYARIYALP